VSRNKKRTRRKSNSTASVRYFLRVLLSDSSLGTSLEIESTELGEKMTDSVRLRSWWFSVSRASICFKSFSFCSLSKFTFSCHCFSSVLL
jgi:hypothetical protein